MPSNVTTSFFDVTIETTCRASTSPYATKGTGSHTGATYALGVGHTVATRLLQSSDERPGL